MPVLFFLKKQEESIMKILVDKMPSKPSQCPYHGGQTSFVSHTNKTLSACACNWNDAQHLCNIDPNLKNEPKANKTCPYFTAKED